MRECKGYIHVHSNYSFDGKNSIEDLAEFFKAKAYRFICLTEHADDFNQAKMTSFVNECAKYSISSFTVVPGLEYRCGDLVHLLGIGTTEYCSMNHPVDVARFIKQYGGIAVIAHPRGYEESLTDELLSVVDGIEIWSGQKDSRFFPHWKNLSTFRKLKCIYPNLLGLGGADLHSLGNYFPLDTMIKMPVEKFSLSGLTDGVSSIRGRYWNLMCNSTFSLETILTLRIGRQILNITRKMVAKAA
jgi:predicted metal-dependent phosphoesterase TrpH